MPYEMLLNEQDVSLDIVARRPDLRVRNGEVVHTVSEVPSAGAAFEIVIDGQTHSGWRYAIGDEVFVRIGTRTFIVGLPQAQLRAHSKGAGHDALHADMPGTVIALHTEVGAEVKAGDKLVTIESMKLQVGLVAPRDGVIEAIHVPAETAFDRGALLISLVALAASEAPPAKSIGA
jgi:acetyl/propionyl-CoA carboxylase alpha subunit